MQSFGAFLLKNIEIGKTHLLNLISKQIKKSIRAQVKLITIIVTTKIFCSFFHFR